MQKPQALIYYFLIAMVIMLAGCTAVESGETVPPAGDTREPGTAPADSTVAPATGAPAETAAAPTDDAGDAGNAPSDIVISLERTACNGICPVYTVTIYGDGTVVFVGESFVEMTGEQTGSIDPAQVDALAAAMLDAGYFEMADAYDTVDMTDMPWAITSLTVDGRTKRIAHYHGDESAPDALRELEDLIDEVADTAQWIGGG